MSALRDDRRRALVLRELVEEVLRGSVYVKTRDIANRTSLSNKEAAAIINEFRQREDSILQIRQRAKTSDSTWSVSIQAG
jgi:hypothetical protein